MLHSITIGIVIAVIWTAVSVSLAGIIGRGIRFGMTGGPHIKH